MKNLKPAAMLVTALFFMFCFIIPALGFNPQPEPPADSAHQVQPDDAMKLPGENELQPGPGSLTETNPGNIKIKPAMQESITETKPIKLQGNQRMMEPLDKEHPPEPGSPQMMQQSIPGPGSDKMQQDPEEEPIQALGTKMMDQGNGTPGGPKMIDPVDDGKPPIQGSPKMAHPPEGPLQPIMKQQQMKR